MFVKWYSDSELVIWLYNEDVQGSECNIIEEMRFLTYLTVFMKSKSNAELRHFVVILQWYLATDSICIQIINIIKGEI